MRRKSPIDLNFTIEWGEIVFWFAARRRGEKEKGTQGQEETGPVIAIFCGISNRGGDWKKGLQNGGTVFSRAYQGSPK